MPYSDYVCTTCDRKLYDVFKGQGVPRPVCPDDASHGEMEWLPSFSSMRSHGFVPFDFEMDGVTTKISDIGQVRRIEEESLKRTANGEGSPTIFRAFSQDQSNYDKNVFGERKQGGHHKQPFITRHDHRPDGDD